MRLFEGTPFDRPPRCEVCGELEEECICPPAPEPRTPPEKQTLKVFVEKRKGKRSVTVVKGLVDEGSHLSDLLTDLKSHCGAGGAIREGTVEIQGDQRDRMIAWLRERKYRIS